MDATTQATFAALLVTGDTYPNRRAIRALGGVWRPLETGYAVPVEREADLSRLAGLTIERVEYAENPFRPLTPDELRAYRQDRKDRYAERLQDRADRADRRAQEARNRISRQERDFLRLFEPVKRGHHSQRRHEKLIERANKAFEDAGREASLAADLRRKAEWIEPARVKGDAEREHKAARDHALSWLALGDVVSHVVYGRGVVDRIGTASVRVMRPDETSFAVCPSSLTLIEKGDGKAPEKAPPAFKPGDLAWWHRHGIANRAHCKPWAVTIKRRTPRGYSVEWTSKGYKPGEVFTYRDTAAAANLEPREEGRAE